MTSLPNPFSAASHAVAEEAAASTPIAPAQDAAATPDYVDLDQECFIGEIFVGALKLDDPEARFVLDEQAFMDALDESPLFLRQVG